MKKAFLKYILSTLSFVIFIAGIYFLADFDLFSAIGFGILLFIHELGHVFALKKLKMSTGGIYFVPFLGAFTNAKDDLITENNFAYLKYAGPFVGTLGVLVFFVAFLIFKDDRLIALSLFGAVFNLINLTPLIILDGYGVLRGSLKHLRWLGLLIIVVVGVFIFKLYILSAFFLLIFTLIAEGEKGYGYRLHELILAILFILAIILVMILENDFSAWNIAIVMFSLFILWLYLKDTLFDNKNQPTQEQSTQGQIKKLIPLTKKQKQSWIIKWLFLVVFLSFLSYYLYSLQI